MKLQCPSSTPFGLNRKVVSDSGRVSAFWGAEVVEANGLKAQSGPRKIQTRLIRSVLTPFVDQESHVSFHTRIKHTNKSLFLMLNLVISNPCPWPQMKDCECSLIWNVVENDFILLLKFAVSKYQCLSNIRFDQSWMVDYEAKIADTKPNTQWVYLRKFIS